MSSDLLVFGIQQLGIVAQIDISEALSFPFRYRVIFQYVGYILFILGVGAYATSRPGAPTRRWGVRLCYSAGVLIITMYGWEAIVSLLNYIYA